jgi:hypothetical protein
MNDDIPRRGKPIDDDQPWTLVGCTARWQDRTMTCTRGHRLPKPMSVDAG